MRLGKIKCAAKVGRLVGGFAALFILRRVGILSVVFLFVCCRSCRSFRVAGNVYIFNKSESIPSKVRR